MIQTSEIHLLGNQITKVISSNRFTLTRTAIICLQKLLKSHSNRSIWNRKKIQPDFGRVMSRVLRLVLTVKSLCWKRPFYIRGGKFSLLLWPGLAVSRGRQREFQRGGSRRRMETGFGLWVSKARRFPRWTVRKITFFPFFKPLVGFGSLNQRVDRV